MQMSDELRAEVCGQTQCHLTEISGFPGLFHRAMVDDLLRLTAAARAAGFELAVASSFRSFERQQAIWADKVAGRRSVLDSSGCPLCIEQLSAEELLWAILRWSALPGASRHHWGTDLDIYDSAAVDQNYRLQLVPEEYSGNGPFAAFTDWLDKRIAAGESFGFGKPYAIDRGGIAPEPWHISYLPQAAVYEAYCNADVLLDLWRTTELPLLAEVEANLETIMQRYLRPAAAVSVNSL